MPHRPRRCRRSGDAGRARAPVRGGAGRRRRAPGDGGGAARRHRAIAHVDVDVEVDAPGIGVRIPAAGDRQGLGDDVRLGPGAQLVQGDDGDAEIGGAPRVRGGIGEVGDADLHHAGGVEPALDEAADGGAVGDPVAEVEVGVDRDETRGLRPPGDGDGRGVVAAEGDDEVGRTGDLAHARLGPLLPVRAVGVRDVAGVEDPQHRRQVDGRRSEERRAVAPEGLAHRGGRRVRGRRGERRAPRRHADDHRGGGIRLAILVRGPRRPAAGPGPQRIDGERAHSATIAPPGYPGVSGTRTPMRGGRCAAPRPRGGRAAPDTRRTRPARRRRRGGRCR